MGSMPECKNDCPTSNAVLQATPAGDNFAWYIRYIVDPSVDQLIGGVPAANLVAEAYQEWTAVTEYLIVQEVNSNPNVTIVMEHIDGDYGILGKAPLAGPGNFNDLTITMDSGEQWTPELFKVAVCHEIGHILGLGHATVSNQLMSPIIESSITGLKTNDIERIQAIYTKAGSRVVGRKSPF